MGVFDLFSKDSRDLRAREKNVSRAINKYAQSPDRMKALQALVDDGSPEALYGLLRRFGMMYDKTIDDEQEKEWVFEVLAEKGSAAERKNRPQNARRLPMASKTKRKPTQTSA